MLVSPLYAGEYSSAPSPAPSDAASYGGTNWFVGGGADYMFDELEEFYFYGQVGRKLNAQSSLFLEAGWIGAEDDASFGGINASADLDIVPITLNYSYEFAFTDKLSMYLGGGLGAAYTELEASASGFGTTVSLSQDDWVFMFQGFSGLIYEFTPAFEGYVGLRYMWFDDPLGASLDDWGVGAGVRFHF
jgi:hypothetical protein